MPEPRRSSRALAEIEPHIRRPDRWIRGNEARLRKRSRSNLELLDGVQPAMLPRLGNLRGRASGSLGALQASHERIRALVFCKPVCNVGQDLKIVSPIQHSGNRCPHCVSEALADQSREFCLGGRQFPPPPRIPIRSGWATPWQPRPDGTTQASLGRPQNVRRAALAGLWACEELKTGR